LFTLLYVCVDVIFVSLVNVSAGLGVGGMLRALGGVALLLP
jgi:hypothetical protein